LTAPLLGLCWAGRDEGTAAGWRWGAKGRAAGFAGAIGDAGLAEIGFTGTPAGGFAAGRAAGLVLAPNPGLVTRLTAALDFLSFARDSNVLGRRSAAWAGLDAPLDRGRSGFLVMIPPTPGEYPVIRPSRVI
jgi:hypothetical protein